MINSFLGIRDINGVSVLIRMVTAFLCGFAIGMERSYKNRAAGFRTHILVCVGASAASMTGLYLYLNLGLPTDISRIGAQVVSGLGFIGAGTIIVTKKPKVTGLTTASGIWVCGIIGLAIGAGFYEGAVATTILVLGAQIFVSLAEQRIPHAKEFQLQLHYVQKKALDSILRTCKNNKLSIVNLQITHANESEDYGYDATITLRQHRKIDKAALLNKLCTVDGILSLTEKS